MAKVKIGFVKAKRVRITLTRKEAGGLLQLLGNGSTWAATDKLGLHDLYHELQDLSDQGEVASVEVAFKTTAHIEKELSSVHEEGWHEEG